MRRLLGIDGEGLLRNAGNLQRNWLGQGSASMTKSDFEQIATLLHEMGFLVQWADLESDFILIKTKPVRL